MDTMHYIFNKFHYITLNHLYLLEYNYIVVSLPIEFCECISSCKGCAIIPHILVRLPRGGSTKLVVVLLQPHELLAWGLREILEYGLSIDST
jgi:hypothetical protein